MCTHGDAGVAIIIGALAASILIICALCVIACNYMHPHHNETPAYSSVGKDINKPASMGAYAGLCAPVTTVICGLAFHGIAVSCSIIMLLSVRTIYTVKAIPISESFYSSNYHLPSLPLLSHYAESIRNSFSVFAESRADAGIQLVRGIVIGDDSLLPSSVQETMQAVSLTHLTAVSGAHVSIILSLIIAVCGLRRSVMTATIAALSLTFLVLLVGLQPSVIRAALMGGLLVTALAVRRPASALPLLCVVTICVSIVFPELSISLGFLLSVSASVAIIVFAYPLVHILSSAFPKLTAQAIAVPSIAQLAISPFLVGIQDAVSPWGILANIVTAPVVAPTTIIGLVGAVLLPLSDIGSLLLELASLGADWIIVVSEHIAAWPPGSLSLWRATLIDATFIGLLVIMVCVMRYFGICFDGASTRQKLFQRFWAESGANMRKSFPEKHSATTFRRLALISRFRIIIGIVLVVLCATGICFAGKLRYTPVALTDWEIIQCDVGQGSAVLARAGSDVVLIDVGIEPSPIERCLRKAHVVHIDLLILSHFDADHVRGLEGVLDSVSIEQVWVSTNPHPQYNSRWVNALLDKHHIPVVEATVHSVFNTWVEILGPRRPRNHESSSNEDSLVVSVNTAHHRMLVLSDTPSDVQRSLLPDIEQSHRVTPFDVVIVSHHGSADQSQQLAQVLKPQVALFSVGKNTYGHPTDEAMRIWRSPYMFSTLRCGTIYVSNERVTSKCAERRQVK